MQSLHGFRIRKDAGQLGARSAPAPAAGVSGDTDAAQAGSTL